MNKKILMATIVLCLISGIMHLPSHAWMRDANIVDSSDSINIGWGIGPVLAGEKIIDNNTSIGGYYMPKSSYRVGLENYLQVSYNKQVIGEKNGTYAFSYYVGVLYSDYWRDHLDMTRTYLIPDIGMAFKWKLSDYSSFRFNMIYYMPAYLEYAHKIQDQLELGISFGMPLQLISLKYLF